MVYVKDSPKKEKMSCSRRASVYAAPHDSEPARDVLQFAPPSVWLSVLPRKWDAVQSEPAREGEASFEELWNASAPTLRHARALQDAGVT